MVIRGNIRGNGEQLAHYLLSGETNENVQILEVNGRTNATDKYLHQTMQGMSLTAELTKSQKGLYHAQINPAYTEDRQMSHKDWLRAADILAQELGLDEQRRVVVLHTKKNRTHAHVVFERYDHQTGKVVDNKFSRLAQDRARKEMERVFEHQPTPHRNKHRPELKETLTHLWSQTETGKDFVKAVHDRGYLLAEGVPRHPFMVVDEQGRSFDLVRQLKGGRIKDVRQRLRHEDLMPEKEAIELMRQKQEGSSDAVNTGQHMDRDRERATLTAADFWNNKQETTLEREEEQTQKRMKSLAGLFMESGHTMTQQTQKSNNLDKKKIRAGEFFSNADDLMGKAEDVADDPDGPSLINNDADLQPESVNRSQRNESREWEEEELAAAITDHRVEEDRKRQLATTRQYFENQEMATEPPVSDESELRKLMEEQKRIREKSRQKSKQRSR